MGFSVRANLTEKEDGRVEEAVIELVPQAYVRESILDYVNLRRERGAPSNAISRNLTTYRNRVIVAPSGNYGSITEVIMRKAGYQKASDSDNRNLVEFWKQIYDIDISPDEIPLLKIKMVNSENTFTYPPSMCFFAAGDFIPAGVQGFIENKKSTLKIRMDDIAKTAIQDLKIGDLSLGSEAAITEQKTDIQAQLVQETRQKLFGRNVSARCSIILAVSLFVMPVIYHHLQFPYTDVDKFKRRAHRFIIFGLIPTAFTLYLGMVLAFSPLIDELAYFVAGLPFAFVYVLYRMRK